MHTVAIIGAAYGDEGKGLATDFVCDYLKKKIKYFKWGSSKIPRRCPIWPYSCNPRRQKTCF